ncbi:DUF1906 domain-containing protein [Paenibacillus sp. SYP-B3998]|uniref:DUF1906 domain-containing protein n=1 Tax=Paenibacillus sp. SYP-B3998 TaxID=2678564 RepID=A0A6G4A335_9BACL|nr:glycoside hydrolase domain-containing protein [Paenibacillus sp. SYP-B3998]NEW08231.1 DUF1906 domain-containing protein [Paenibacillus sp. SYP-B3998]
MAKGFDCATALTSSTIQPFATQGFKFVGRYLADAGSWKRLSPNEVKIISAAGLYIVSFFERSSDRVKEGALAGTEDGKLALQYAKEVGQIAGSAIYAAVDYDAPSRDFNAIEAYMRAFDKEIDGYELGIYGSYSVVKAMYERGVATKLMQTYAWSRGQKFAPIGIYQYQNDIIVNQIGIDLDESNGDAGGWKLGMAVAKNGFSLDDRVTDYILDVLGDYWKHMEGNKDVQEYTHQVSNSLRRAVGRPEE